MSEYEISQNPEMLSSIFHRPHQAANWSLQVVSKDNYIQQPFWPSNPHLVLYPYKHMILVSRVLEHYHSDPAVANVEIQGQNVCRYFLLESHCYDIGSRHAEKTRA